MEPLNDGELNRLLHQWNAPGAPPHLRPPSRPSRESWWRWFVTGTIRVPVPVGLALVVIIATVWVYTATRRAPVVGSEPSGDQPVVSLADFRPVEEVELRVVGGGR